MGNKECNKGNFGANGFKTIKLIFKHEAMRTNNGYTL